MNYHKYISKDIIRQIKTSRKQLTILFTDIEGSTNYWDTRGDINGRLMVDQHNRLIFPVVKKFHGKIIKTIGDAIMASFKNPAHAVEAAIAIQQLLAKERKINRRFTLRVRIGIHTGRALVEHNDIFGNVVNIAARVEGRGKGNDILMSGSTAMKISRKKYRLTKQGTFTPKGKKRKMTIYRCHWQKLPTLIEDIKLTPLLPVIRRQKLNILAYIIATIGLFYFIYIKYIRYLLADSEYIALLALNPASLLHGHPANWAILLVIGLSSVFLIIRIRRIPTLLLKALKGGFGFCLVFILVYIFFTTVPVDLHLNRRAVIHESGHLFVHTMKDETAIYRTPSFDAKIIRKVNRGILLLLSDVRRIENTVWNKVLLDQGKHGWIIRVTPAKLGVPPQRFSLTNKFYLRLLDVYAFIIGCIGFAWGFCSFKIQPA